MEAIFIMKFGIFSISFCLLSLVVIYIVVFAAIGVVADELPILIN